MTQQRLMHPDFWSPVRLAWVILMWIPREPQMTFNIFTPLPLTHKLNFMCRISGFLLSYHFQGQDRNNQCCEPS